MEEWEDGNMERWKDDEKIKDEDKRGGPSKLRLGGGEDDVQGFPRPQPNPKPRAKTFTLDKGHRRWDSPAGVAAQTRAGHPPLE